MGSKEEDTKKAQGERLARARQAAGYRSARAASEDNGWNEGTYRSHEKGRRKIGEDDAEKYARRYRLKGVPIDGQSILYGTDAPKARRVASDKADRQLVAEALLTIAQLAQTVPADTAGYDEMMALAARLVAEYVLEALGPHEEDSDSRPDPGSVRSHIQGVFSTLRGLSRKQ